MQARRAQAVRRNLTVAVGLTMLALPMSTPPRAVDFTAACARGEVPNPAGYGCIPALAPGGAVVGPPSEEVLSACHGGDLYFCVDPYRIP